MQLVKLEVQPWPLLLEIAEVILFEMASKQSGYTSVFEAQLAALAWASEYAKDKKWGKAIRSLDAVVVVKEILSKYDPKGWSFRYTLLQVRNLFARFNWLICWNARSSNVLADALAKFTFNSNCSFLFYASNLTLFQQILFLFWLLTSWEFLCNSPPLGALLCYKH